MKIVKPSTKDIPQLIRLWEQQYQLHHSLDSKYYVPNSEPLTKEFERYLSRAIKQNKPHILIAKSRGQIIGFITFSSESTSYFDTQIKKFGEVLELFVDEKFHKQGIGKNLLTAAEKHFAKLGLKHIKLECSMFNQSAIQFYQRLGYINRQALLFKQLQPTD